MTLALSYHPLAFTLHAYLPTHTFLQQEFARRLRDEQNEEYEMALAADREREELRQAAKREEEEATRLAQEEERRARCGILEGGRGEAEGSDVEVVI